ncbi:hypothetical protein AB1E18_005855 [Capra hircus]
MSDKEIRKIKEIAKPKLITGLSDETAEFLQVADYGIGGHYEPHVDSFLDFDSNPLEFIVTGNRVATFMNYGRD